MISKNIGEIVSQVDYSVHVVGVLSGYMSNPSVDLEQNHNITQILEIYLESWVALQEISNCF